MHILKSGWISSSFILFLFFNLPGTCFYNKCFKRTSAHLVGVIRYKGITCQFLRFHRLSIVIKTDITTLIIIPTYIFPFLVYPPCLQLVGRNRLKETRVARPQPYTQCFPWCSNEQHQQQVILMVVSLGSPAQNIIKAIFWVKNKSDHFSFKAGL